LQPPAGPVFLSIPLDDWEKTRAGACGDPHGEPPPQPGRRSGCAASLSGSIVRSGRCWCSVRRWTAAAPGTPAWRSPKKLGGARVRELASRPGVLPRGPPPVSRAAADDHRRGHRTPARVTTLAIVVGAQGVPVLPLRPRRIPARRDRTAANHHRSRPGGARPPVGDRRPWGRPARPGPGLVGMVDDPQ